MRTSGRPSLSKSMPHPYNETKIIRGEYGIVLTLEWLGGAGFRITDGETTLLIDPYVSRNRLARPHQPLTPSDLRGDAPIFLSHGHFDHAGDLTEIVQGTPATIYGSATALAPMLRAGTPIEQLHAVSNGDVLHFGGCRAEGFHSRHVRFDLPLIWRALRRARSDILQSLNLALRYPAGEVLSWRFSIGAMVIHHFGSAGSTREELARWAGSRTDVLLVPLQGHSRICDLAAAYVDSLQPVTVIPHHHDDFYPPISEMTLLEPFEQIVYSRLADTRVIRPVINQPITLQA